MFICVAGLARCGSSLLMQQLHAGGLPCVGEPPAFEGYNTVLEEYGLDPAWEGCAVKVLLPHTLSPFPRGRFLWFWLDRDRHAQALSHVKFCNLVLGLPSEPTWEVERRLKEHRVLALKRVRRVGGRLVKLSYEALKQQPRSTAESVAAEVQRALGAELDVDKMVSCVLDRWTECRYDLLEVDQVRRRGNG